jgi:hypothetical protein
VNSIDTAEIMPVFDVRVWSDRIYSRNCAASLCTHKWLETEYMRIIKRSDNRLHIFIATFLFSSLV